MATPFDKQQPGELRPDEKVVMNLLVDAWNAFVQLEEVHPSHRSEFATHLHDLQRIIISREYSRRENTLSGILKEVDRHRFNNLVNPEIREVPFPEYDMQVIELCVLHGKPAAMGQAPVRDYQRGQCKECQKDERA